VPEVLAQLAVHALLAAERTERHEPSHCGQAPVIFATPHPARIGPTNPPTKNL
jgi:hypothetical protein